MQSIDSRADRRVRALALAYFLTAFAVLAFGPDCRAQESSSDSPSIYEKSSWRMLAAFRKVVARPSLSTVRVRCDGRDAALGTIVGPDGWVLTKASEMEGNIVVRLRNGREMPARVVGVQEKNDLALLKIDAKGLKAVEWVDSAAAPVGNWVAAPGTGTDPVAVGVVSVAARGVSEKAPPFSIDPSRGYMGIVLEPLDDQVKIGGISDDAPAAKAGLKVNDTLVSVGSTTIKSIASLTAALESTKPGDTIRVRVKRDGAEKEYKITLGKRPEDRADFQDRLGSELSKRRKGFPNILQHDTVLKPADCGGPLVDLDGHVLGINIARAGRTETYAVPSEIVLPLLRDLSAGKLSPVLVKKGEDINPLPLKKKGGGKTSLPRGLQE